MLENTSVTLNQNRILHNLAILAAVSAAVAIIVLTINSFGLFRSGPAPEIPQTNGDVLLQTENLKFVQQDIHIKAGTEVELDLVNSGVIPHSFDVDELDLHIKIPAKESTIATFTALEPGTYTFYCAKPGHRAAGMVGTLVVEP